MGSTRHGLKLKTRKILAELFRVYRVVFLIDSNYLVGALSS